MSIVEGPLIKRPAINDQDRRDSSVLILIKTTPAETQRGKEAKQKRRRRRGKQREPSDSDNALSVLWFFAAVVVVFVVVKILETSLLCGGTLCAVGLKSLRRDSSFRSSLFIDSIVAWAGALLAIYL